MLYTILLNRPDYLTGGDLDTFLTTAEGDTPQAAVDAARLEAANADGIEEGNLTDYAVLLVIAGEHDDVSYLVDNQ